MVKKLTAAVRIFYPVKTTQIEIQLREWSSRQGWWKHQATGRAANTECKCPVYQY